MNAYHAAPFMSTDGRVKGTICHFDESAMPLTNEDFELLRLAARVFPMHIGAVRANAIGPIGGVP